MYRTRLVKYTLDEFLARQDGEILVKAETLAPEDVSDETVQVVFDDAGFPTAVNDHGSLLVQGEHICFNIMVECADNVRIFSLHRIAAGADEADLFRAINRFNSNMVGGKAHIIADEDYQRILVFETDMNVEGGLSRVNLVMRFLRLECIICTPNSIHPLLDPQPKWLQNGGPA